MAKEKFVRKHIPSSRIEEIAGNCKEPKASTTAAICMVCKTLDELESRRNDSKK